MKKNSTVLWLALVILVVIVFAVYKSYSPKVTEVNNNEFTLGAVLPLTGAASLWGETTKNGMDLALEQKTGIKVLYEDSKSTVADGISAYNLLQSKGVSLTVSETSLVSVPLSKIALERKLPLLVTLVAAEHSKIVNDYTMRYYTDPTNTAKPAFEDPISPVINAKKIAVLYRNDELGVSIKDKIAELSAGNKKEIAIQESFIPNEKDFRTMLKKIKNSGADVLIFVPGNAPEAVGIVKTANELSLNLPMVESSAVFADPENRKQVGNISFYSTSYDFLQSGKAEEFKAKYRAKYGKEPNFGSAFGYDMINLIYSCKDKSGLWFLAYISHIL
jgi:branched-chain amino acid transport system substrate-binding protein